MKKIVLLIVMFLLCLPLIVSAGTTGTDCGEDCGIIDQIRKEVAEEYRETSKEVYKTYLKKPDWSKLWGCLDTINMLKLGFSFSLPSLDQLLGMACEFVDDTIDAVIDEATAEIEQKFSYYTVGGFGGSLNTGTGQNSDGNPFDADIKVNDNSDDIVDAIWRELQ